jgi:hypothetical protein
MPFLWLAVDDPGPDSDRGVIKCNAITPLSHIGKAEADRSSDSWHGHWSDRAVVCKSGLWNVHSVGDQYSTAGLDVLARPVDGVATASTHGR